MPVEARLSKHKKNNFKIGIALCTIFAVFFAYDGYLSGYNWSMRYSFYKKHVIDNDGKPTSTMNFNRKSPPVFIAAAAISALYLFAIRNRKIVAGETGLVINDKKKISYDSIRKINKTYFQKKGFFIITYKNADGRDVDCKISNRTYDNLEAIVDELVAKIS